MDKPSEDFVLPPIMIGLESDTYSYTNETINVSN